MRESFTPEEVDSIENAAFEVGFRIGVTQERERIISILEAEAESDGPYCSLPIDREHCQSCWQFDYLIKLIRGK